MVAEFNTEHWPVIYLKLGGKVVNDDIFEEYQREYLNLLIKCKKNNEKMVLITDLTYINDCNNIPIKYLMKQVQFSKKIYEFNKKYLKCVVILCKNKSTKNLIKSIMNFTKEASPYKICRTSKKANLYLYEKFKVEFNIEIFNEDLKSHNEDDKELSDNNSNNESIINKINLENDNDSKKEVFTEYFNQLSL